MSAGLDDGVLDAARAWLSQDPDGETRAELRDLVDRAEQGDAAASDDLADRFAGRLAFGTAGLYGGAVGTLVGSITYAAPQLGLSLTLGGFVALALGGQGNFLGALFGGLLVGIVNSLSVTYIGANYGQVAVLAVLLVVFVAKPAGIGGAAALRNV